MITNSLFMETVPERINNLFARFKTFRIPDCTVSFQHSLLLPPNIKTGEIQFNRQMLSSCYVPNTMMSYMKEAKMNQTVPFGNHETQQCHLHCLIHRLTVASPLTFIQNPNPSALIKVIYQLFPIRHLLFSVSLSFGSPTQLYC